MALEPTTAEETSSLSPRIRIILLPNSIEAHRQGTTLHIHHQIGFSSVMRGSTTLDVRDFVSPKFCLGETYDTMPEKGEVGQQEVTLDPVVPMTDDGDDDVPPEEEKHPRPHDPQPVWMVDDDDEDDDKGADSTAPNSTLSASSDDNPGLSMLPRFAPNPRPKKRRRRDTYPHDTTPPEMRRQLDYITSFWQTS